MSYMLQNNLFCCPHYLEQRCGSETEEWKMKVDVNNGTVLIFSGWENHLKRSKTEGLKWKDRSDPSHRETTINIGLRREREHCLTTCSCPGGGKGTRDNLAENSLIVSSKSSCLAVRNWTSRLKNRRTKKKIK